MKFAPKYLLGLLMLPELCAGVTIGQIDTFQDGTLGGWFAGGGPGGGVPPTPPEVVATGGSAGAGDQYLKITSQGGSGPGSRLVVLNASQWTGNFLFISGIGMDLINLGATDLQIRLLFEDPMGGPPTDEAVSTSPFLLPAGSGWVHAFFPTTAASYTAILGSASTALSQTTVMRIIHSSVAGDPIVIAGSVGIDNISAVPEPATLSMLAAGIFLLAAVRSRLQSKNSRTPRHVAMPSVKGY